MNIIVFCFYLNSFPCVQWILFCYCFRLGFGNGRVTKKLDRMNDGLRQVIWFYHLKNSWTDLEKSRGKFGVNVYNIYRQYIIKYSTDLLSIVVEEADGIWIKYGHFHWKTNAFGNVVKWTSCVITWIMLNIYWFLLWLLIGFSLRVEIDQCNQCGRSWQVISKSLGLCVIACNETELFRLRVVQMSSWISIMWRVQRDEFIHIICIDYHPVCW